MLELSPSTVYRKNKLGKRMKLISNNLEVPIAGEVWILLDSGMFGGIESHVIELSKGLQASHVHVRVVLVSEYSPPAPLVGKLEHANIHFSYLWHLCPKSERSKNIPIKQMTSAIAEHQPSVIHTHGYKSALLARGAKLFTRAFPALSLLFMPARRPKGGSGCTTGLTDTQLVFPIIALRLAKRYNTSSPLNQNCLIILSPFPTTTAAIKKSLL